MPDYGHHLEFGTFLTPSADRPGKVVDLAVTSEEAGLDLVTFQDHPYQPGHLDAWTLLSWVAARTSTIRVAGNVLNSPLRQPAVLARQVAALDRLSGGRVDVGLGAGGFWDAIEAMGAERLTPGESVEALEDAMDIMRAIWDTTERGGARIEGRHHRVSGAKRGPEPTRDIPLWLGGYKPRMLRLVGRKADGWLPSLPYLKDGDLQRGNTTIDAAAGAAGRDPREIVRLLNIPASLSTADIVDHALRDGISTFLLMSDDPREISRFGREVAPAVRKEVAAGRARLSTSTQRRVRSSDAMARRVEGIAYDDIPDSLEKHAVEPGDRGYARYTSGHLRGGSPGLVLRPRTVDEVSDAIAFASRHRDRPLGILSAGHGISGRSLNNGGLVIDVGAFDHIDVLDAEAGIVRIGPGAIWMDVAAALAPHGLAISSGDYGGVGVGGLATAGGIGWLARRHGLTIDHLRAVDLVLADGTVTRASAQENPDLYWAVRGAGANFGIAVSFEFQAERVGQVGYAQLQFDASDTVDFLEAWGEALEAADRRVSGEVIIGRPPLSGPTVATAMLVVDSDDPDTIIELLNPLAATAPLVGQHVSLTTYDQVMASTYRPGPQQATGEPISHSGLLNHLSREFAEDAAELIAAGASHFFQIRSVGGAVADVDPGATAYGWRAAAFSVAAFGTTASRIDHWWKRLLPHFDGLYLSFETDRDDAALNRAFPDATLRRLRDLKRRFDPTGLFRDNFYISPDED